ncbi:NAD(P)-dependent oxidoreductase [Paenibacillus alvei]|uniref:NAD(P)-dependent oxidoreductase n=1 Tax=Paenibacillus alvei TaxID=44250 RepID=A0ABT4GQQ2_PAEAL|nr:NAD(P)-dependent oxidoreductase [Paenibacillus alvei]MCY7485852.1 NAD(P)-dependent oxidoreductase [Paenibacillus alvei]MCY9759020.1 NAD(P)-dependent oxidoreductase [Paenibacillus alvei]MCY9768315.1 NAD(P)-dependent oxidoreductase [Paenibacillus alvei]
MKAAVLGLGTMGAPMAANLLGKGFEVTVYNRSKEKTIPLVEQGAHAADLPQAAAEQSDIIITMVSDDSSIEAIYYGDDGVLAGVRSGQVIVDCSTISPSLVQRLAAACAERGAQFLDAPVTGSKPAAVEGTLVFMVGGEDSALQRAMPVLEAMGRMIVHMGPNGSGSITKLAHNTIVGINNAALAEGFAMVSKAGVNPEAFLQVVRNGSAGSKAAELKGEKIIAGNFDNQFSLQLMLKDLKLASVLTDAMQTPTPMLELAKSLFQMGQTAGYGEEDLCSLVKIYEQWIGHPIGHNREKQ